MPSAKTVSHSFGFVLQKRTAVEKWLVVAGSGVVAGLVALLWQLVSGAAVTDPLPKLALACVFACLLAILIMVTFSQRKSNARVATST